VGTGVGGGLVFEGHPYEGTHGFAGEIGHLPIDEEGEPCECGRFGCLETVAGASYLVARARAAVEKGVETSLASRAPDLTGPGLTGKDVFDAARAGDPFAAGLVTRAGKALGRSSAIALQLLDLDRIILGGGLGRSADLLLPQIMREAQARTFPQIFERATFATAELGHWAGALGVARAAALRFAPTS
jgi:glucokinase